MAVTYKTVITNAINGFNSIQNALADLGGLDVSTVSGTGTITTGISAAELAEKVKNLAVIKDDVKFYSGVIPVYDPEIDK